MAGFDECIVCLNPVMPSPDDYDTYSIMQSCSCIYVAHPQCIAQWVSARGTCVICHKIAAIGYRHSVIAQMQDHQANTSDVANVNHRRVDHHRVAPTDSEHRPAQQTNTRCCTIL